MVALQSWKLPDQWQFGYELGGIGKNIAEGNGFAMFTGLTAKFPPVYPIFIGGVFAVFGIFSQVSAAVLFLFQSIQAAVTAACLVVIGSFFFGRKQGLVAGLLWAVYPSSIFHSVVRIYYSELALMIVCLLIVLAISKKPLNLIARVAAFGGLTGVLILTDSTMALYSVLLLLWMLRLRKIEVRKWIGPLAVFAASAVVVVSPWAIRNFIVLGHPTIVRPNFGLELFYGNNPYSSGGGINEERVRAEAPHMHLKEAYRRGDFPEREYFQYLGTQAMEWIGENPGRFAKLSIKRFSYYWGKFPSTGPGIWRNHTWKQLVWYVPIALLALWGLYYSRHRWRDIAPIWLFLLVYPLPYYVTHVQLYRYRYPVELFLILLAAVPVTMLLQRLHRLWAEY
jgi:hypothetical protein